MILNNKIHEAIKNNIIPNANAIFIFILIVSSNYLDDLFPCKVRTFMRNNILMKHLVGFMVLYFLTILTFPQLKSVKGIINAFWLYFLFILTSKINYIAWAIVMFIFAIVYLLNIAVDDLHKKTFKSKADTIKHKKHIKFLKRLMSWLILLNLVIIIVGFIYYYGTKIMQHGDNFSYLRFFFDVPICGFDIKKGEHYMPFKKAFKLS
jgi:hypothetical protein